MSLILEALKKIESDKSKQVRKVDIAAAILLPGRSAGPRRILLSAGIFLSAAVLLVAAGAGISYLLLPKQPPVQSVQAGQSASTPTAAGFSPSATATDGWSAARTPSVLAKYLAAEKPPAVEQIPRDVEGVESAEPQAAPPPARRAPVKAAVKAPALRENASINLTGIIWSQDGAKSRALVNGASVREGDTIDGAYVERIEQNRIYCSKNGKSFMVPVRTDNE